MGGRRRILAVAALAGAVLVVAGCSGPSVVATRADGASPAPASAASGTTDSAASDSAAADGTDTAGADPTVMATTASVTVYYVAPGDGGETGILVGCGDSAVAVTSGAISFTDPVEGALRILLADHQEQVGESGLDNALWASRLSVKNIDRSGTVITVNLVGTLVPGGACDIPRIDQQILLTARVAAGGPVDVTVNGKTLSAALGRK
ncbi:hypothetical protein [Arthrobacter sp. ERGS1:01]|uniref:hypothetical protein n=1 Tax=Arthrobacter sp. ERGS1:01 TaxID=1704044 RepID=UPI000A42F274|nr:hypothetical protein [Arthrobacter sp. ERGS1:01]